MSEKFPFPAFIIGIIRNGGYFVSPDAGKGLTVVEFDCVIAGSAERLYEVPGLAGVGAFRQARFNVWADRDAAVPGRFVDCGVEEPASVSCRVVLEGGIADSTLIDHFAGRDQFLVMNGEAGLAAGAGLGNKTDDQQRRQQNEGGD